MAFSLSIQAPILPRSLSDASLLRQSLSPPAIESPQSNDSFQIKFGQQSFLASERIINTASAPPSPALFQAAYQEAFTLFQKHNNNLDGLITEVKSWGVEVFQDEAWLEDLFQEMQSEASIYIPLTLEYPDTEELTQTIEETLEKDDPSERILHQLEQEKKVGLFIPTKESQKENPEEFKEALFHELLHLMFRFHGFSTAVSLQEDEEAHKKFHLLEYLSEEERDKALEQVQKHPSNTFKNIIALCAIDELKVREFFVAHGESLNMPLVTLINNENSAKKYQSIKDALLP